MIRPPWRSGVAFSEEGDGDLRGNSGARNRLSARIGISSSWATVRQVHGGDVVFVDAPGDAGTADALWTTMTDLPLAVFTADCFGVVLQADSAVGVAHAGWRGADQAVVANLRREMSEAGYEPGRGAIGPGIGSCCFEVGPEVVARFRNHTAETTWGTSSVDLAAVIGDQLEGVATWSVEGCTHHEDRWFSHRRDGTLHRLATIGWLP